MKKYSGFTLIEMLIVMGIIIILMAVGIAGGRFAIQRAHRIQKRSAVDNIEQALWGYYTDFRQFPNADGNPITPRQLIDGSGAILAEYLDAGSWDGGSDGSFWYMYAANGQDFVVCGSLGGHDDIMGTGIYCTGNSLTSRTVFDSDATASDNIYLPASPGGYVGDPVYGEIQDDFVNSKSDWYGESRSWTAPVVP